MCIRDSSCNVSEIADIIGYDNPLYFGRIFKKQCGMSPSEFRKRLQNAAVEVKEV